jgi:hypothetical protein
MSSREMVQIRILRRLRIAYEKRLSPACAFQTSAAELVGLG